MAKLGEVSRVWFNATKDSEAHFAFAKDLLQSELNSFFSRVNQEKTQSLFGKAPPCMAFVRLCSKLYYRYTV
jgi:hypothetical protein